MRLTILSRASDLAQIQAASVCRALAARWPELQLERRTRSAAGDRDRLTPLPAFEDKGAFTADLSEALERGDADLVVHSWKDLPTEARPGTDTAGTCPRADSRDVLLLRAGVRERRPDALAVLSSSPRRAWLLAETLPDLLPWRVRVVEARPVRGNVPTRLRKLLGGEADGLMVAKAALDRLLDAEAPFDAARAAVRRAIEGCDWMVLPRRSWPTAPAQGALALEIARGRDDVAQLIGAVSDEPTQRAVRLERELLAGHGGGCHAVLGATVLPRPYGLVVSMRRRTESGACSRWSLERERPRVPRVSAAALWPRPDERPEVTREPLDLPAEPPAVDGLWVARADALPPAWSARHLIWTAGERTWRRLAARGVWVNGCADGLGDAEAPDIDRLAGRAVGWRRVTHCAAAAGDPDAVATYRVRRVLPPDLADRAHFFWTSGTEFRDALTRWPVLRERWHASGPGRTSRTLRGVLGPAAQVDVWLDVDSWRDGITA